MNWINLEVKTLRSEEYISSDPTERATWLNLLAWCCEQENGGVIKDCRDWGDRKWSQICGVFKSEIEAGKHLFFFEENNLRIMFYPLDKEEEVRTKRNVGKVGGSATSDAKAEAARINGSKGGRPPKETQAETQAEKPNNPSKTQAETQGKGKEGKGKEGNIPPKSPKLGDSQKTTSQKLSWSVADGWQGVTDDLRAKWAMAYPACDIDRHLAAMDVWLRANPTRAVKSNWAAFAARWLSKEQNSGGDLRYKNQGGNNAAYRNRNQPGRTVGTLNEGADFTKGVKTAADILAEDDDMDNVPT